MLRSGGVGEDLEACAWEGVGLELAMVGDGSVLMLAWCRNAFAGGWYGWWNVDAFISVVNLGARGDRSGFEEEIPDCPTRSS